MTVALEPPLTTGLAFDWYRDAVALTAAPRYLRTAGMSRWHRPRSGIDRAGRIFYDLWCGQSLQGDHLAAEQAPDGEPVCGTCEGRAVGAGQDTWAQDGPWLIFSPARLTPPARCPGSRTMMCEEVGRTVGRCLVCGEYVPMRASGGPYNPHYGMTNHEPGPALVPGCPFHAWRGLRVVDGGVICECRIDQA